jgi:1-acyl-sn-glycerol-3-phosphate acyltransferase
MRPVYFFLRIILPYSMRVFFRKVVTLHSGKQFKERTIFVCNHPSAFMDPLSVANFQWAIIHFMTRSDVFKPWLRPITWACHMVPVYRLAEDGKENMEKNIASFREAINVLKNKKSLIMFGEGYTDDVFIRSLKPMKKGPARIGFSAMVDTNWEMDVLIRVAGVNYTDPKYFRSDCLVSMGKIIHLKEYRDLYLENPNRAITQLTREIEKSLQDEITYVKDKSLAPFVEHIQIISRLGMNQFCYDPSLALQERFEYSRTLARVVNERYDINKPEWSVLKSDLESYFAEQEKANVDENWVYQYAKKNSRNLGLRFLYLVLMFPVFLVGLVHGFIPYIITKVLVEKAFKRDVFWSGVKMIIGSALATLYNLPLIWLFHDYVFPSYWLGFLYFMTVPATSIVLAYQYGQKLKDTVRILKTKESVIASFVDRRKKLVEKINQFGFNYLKSS